MNLYDLKNLKLPQHNALFAVCWKFHGETGELDWEHPSVYQFDWSDIDEPTTAEECVLREFQKLCRDSSGGSWSDLGGFVATLADPEEGITVRARFQTDDDSYCYEKYTVYLADIEVEFQQPQEAE